MQSQIAEITQAFKCSNDENLILKNRIKDLEAKNLELSELSKNPTRTETIQSQVEKITFEKQNLKIENLEQILKDVRAQLQQAQDANDELRNKNKQLLEFQHEFLLTSRKVS